MLATFDFHAAGGKGMRHAAEHGVGLSLALAGRGYVLEKGAVRFTDAAAAFKSDRALLDRLMAV